MVAAIFNGVISPLFRGTGMFLVVVLGFVWVVAFLALSVISPMMVRFGPESNILGYIGWIAIVLTLTIPVLAIILGLSGWAFRYRTHSAIKMTLLTTWFLSLFTSATIVAKTTESYKHRKEMVTMSDYVVPEDEVHIKTTDDLSPKQFFGIMTSNLRLSPEALKIGGLSYSVKESDDHLLHVERKVVAMGKNEQDAIRNMESVKDNFEVSGNEIRLSRLLEIEAGKKYRGQQVSYIIYVPKGKKVMDDRQSFSHNDDENSEEGLDETDTEDLSANEDDNQTSHFVAEGSISNITIAGPVSLIVKQGDKPGYTVNAPESVRSRLKIRQDSQSINLTCREDDGCEEVALVIVTPDIRMLSLYDLNSIDIRGFQSEKLKLISHSASTRTKINIDSRIKTLDLNVDGPQTVQLKGEGNLAELHLAGGASISGKAYKVKNAVIHGSDYGRSELWVTDNVNMVDGVRPEFVFTGNPAINR